MRTVSVKLMADAADFSRKMRGAGADVKSLSGELDRANKAGRLDELTSAATGFGIGLVGVAGIAAKFAMDFEKQMSHVKAATHASAGEMEQLRQAALKAGADTQFSATQAAQGVEELAKAGIATTDILSGGLKGALDLAAAGTMEVADAAEITASALTQFKLKGSDVPHVADLLSAAAGKAQGSVADMGAALNQSGLIAAQTGLTIEDTTGTLAAFANAGLLGSDAGTSFKTMLQHLQAPSGATRKLMEKLGISAYDASGQFIGITALAGQLKTQLSTLTPELRANAMAQIFGSDATRAASILYEQGAAGIQGWIDKTNDAGYAAETAAIKTDNLAGDLERLKGSLETLAIEAGGGANGGLRVLTQGLNAMVDQFAALPPGVSSTITVLAGVSGAAVLAGVGWLKMRHGVADAVTELRNAGPASAKAATALEKTSMIAGRAAGAFVALQVAQAAVSAAQDDLSPQVQALGAGLEKWSTGATLSGEAARVLGGDMSSLRDKFKFLADEDSNRRAAVRNMQGAFESLVPGLAGANESLARTRERVTAVDAALSGMVQGGSGEQARAVFERLTKELAVEGVTIDEVKKKFPQYAAALEVAKTATSKVTGGTKELTGAASDATEKVEELKDAFDELFGAQMSIDRANLKYVEGIQAVTKELKTGTRTLALDTQEGRKNRSAVLDQIATIDDLRAARIKHGMSLDDANKKYVKDIDGLRKSMRQAGFTEKQVKELTRAYRDVPSKVSTKLDVTGEGPVKQVLSDLLVAQAALKKGITLSSARAAITASRRAIGRPVFHGGGWTGPGAEHDEAGIVHADEYVVRKESRQRFERENPGALDHINRTGRMPMYDVGGRVMWPFPTSAAGTRVPSRAEALAAVAPAGPGGATTGPWMERMIESRFPGLEMISGFRRGSRTLSGSLSYHAQNRAVDFPPSRDLARFMYMNFKARLKEAITPYQEYNVHNGRDRRWTGAVWNQHNFAGGNAHDHFAMANGGVINEHVYGVGASGRTYEFGERGRPETVVPGYLPSGQGGGGSSTTTVIHLTAQLAPGANAREAGRLIAEQLQTYLVGGGSINVRGAQVLP